MTKTTTTKRSAKVQAAIDADLAKQRQLRKDSATTVEPVTAASAPTEDGALTAEGLKQAAQEAIMKLLGVGDHAVSWKRKMAAFFASLMLSGGAGYLIGQLAGYAIVGIASLGGSVLWGYLILVLAAIFCVYASLKITEHASKYILSGQIDRDIASVKGKVLGFFKREPKTIPVAA